MQSWVSFCDLTNEPSPSQQHFLQRCEKFLKGKIVSSCKQASAIEHSIYCENQKTHSSVESILVLSETLE